MRIVDQPSLGLASRPRNIPGLNLLSRRCGGSNLQQILSRYIAPAPPAGGEVWYVDPSASGSSQDGTTTNPYLSLNGALAGKCNKTFTVPIQIRCRTSSSTPDTVRASTGALGQMVTSATNYLQIVAETGNRAGSSWDATKYHLYTAYLLANKSGVALDISKPYVYVDGLQIGVSTQSGQLAADACEIVYWSTTVGAQFEGVMSNCIIKGTNNADNTLITRGISIIYGLYMYNTIIYAIGGGGSPNGSSGIQAHVGGYFYSLTVICNGGITAINLDDGTFTMRNCYAGGSVWFTAINNEGTTDMEYCATSDTSAFGTGSIDNVPVNTTTFTNVTVDSENWSLGGSSAIEAPAGIDTSGTAAPLNFTTDILGTARGSSWSIGAVQS